MTDAFLAQMKRLRVLRFPPLSMDGHWTVLGRVPLDVMEAAVTRALSSQSEFPTPHELAVFCDAVNGAAAIVAQEDKREMLPSPVAFVVPHVQHPLRVTAHWRYDCDDCGDGGMVSYWCGEHPAAPWYVPADCGRRGVHGAHEWVSPCPCAATNPTIQRRLAARAKYAAEPHRRTG